MRIKDRTADGYLLRIPAASAPALAEIVLLRDAKDQMQICQSDLPPELRGLRMSGPDWTLILHDQMIGWVVSDAPPALFPAAGTLTEKTKHLLGAPALTASPFAAGIRNPRPSWPPPPVA